MKNTLKNALHSRMAAINISDTLKKRILASLAEQKTHEQVRLKWKGIFATAACIAAAVMFILLFPMKNSQIAQLPKTSADQQGTADTNIEQPPQQKRHVVTGEAGGAVFFAGAGTVILSTDLKNALSKSENADAVFYVTILFQDFSEDAPRESLYKTFTYEGKTVEEWEQVWIESQQAQNFEMYQKAQNARDDAVSEFQFNYATLAFQAEFDRLLQIGLDIKPKVYTHVNRNNNYITGYLTKEQLINFPKSNDIGYVIDWAPADDDFEFGAY